MKRTCLILILILAALLTAAFLPGFAPDTPATGAAEDAHPGPVDFPASPAVRIAVAMIVILFGGLTLLPLFWRECAG